MGALFYFAENPKKKTGALFKRINIFSKKFITKS